MPTAVTIGSQNVHCRCVIEFARALASCDCECDVAQASAVQSRRFPATRKCAMLKHEINK